jgi:hypothetical protein
MTCSGVEARQQDAVLLLSAEWMFLCSGGGRSIGATERPRAMLRGIDALRKGMRHTLCATVPCPRTAA